MLLLSYHSQSLQTRLVQSRQKPSPTLSPVIFTVTSKPVHHRHFLSGRAPRIRLRAVTVLSVRCFAVTGLKKKPARGWQALENAGLSPLCCQLFIVSERVQQFRDNRVGIRLILILAGFDNWSVTADPLNAAGYQKWLVEAWEKDIYSSWKRMLGKVSDP